MSLIFGYAGKYTCGYVRIVDVDMVYSSKLGNGLLVCQVLDTLVENQTGITVKKLRMDNGLEFCNREFEQLCIESGIARNLTVVGTPQQNQVAERMNKTFMDKVSCLLIQSGLPKTFWAEATAYLINRSPSRAIKKNTAMEMWSGHPTGYGMLRIFGCVSYPHDKQVTRRNVVFNESVMYKDTLKDSGASNKSFKELQVEVELQRLNNHTPEEDQTDQEDGDDEDAGDQATNQPPDLTDYQLVWDREPNHPAGQKLVSCKWLFKIKERIKGVQKPRYKERLVAHGFTQSSCIDYNKVFSLVVRHTSIRVILALTVCKDYELEQLDVKTAFLHGNLEEVIYMRQPPGYEQGNKEFDMKELEEAKKILGMEIIRDRSHKILRVSQSGYISKILNNFRIDNGKSVKMPLGGHFKLSLKDCSVRECVVRMSKVPYVNAVGSLMYLMVCMRPDIAYVVSVVSRYLANPGKNHWDAVKLILKYLRGTTSLGLVYETNRRNHVDVTGFVDSDYAKDPDKGSGSFNYKGRVYGPYGGYEEAIWLRRLLEELVVELNTVAVNCDNQGAVHLSRNHIFHERTKHINVRYHFIREVLEAKMVNVLKVGTEHNVADTLTKVVPGLKLQHCLELLNVGVGEYKS
nr:hypothetical protein [Tanacetum cinerariifolium]